MERKIKIVLIFITIGFIAFAMFPAHALQLYTNASVGPSVSTRTATSGAIFSDAFYSYIEPSPDPSNPAGYYGDAFAQATDNGNLTCSAYLGMFNFSGNISPDIRGNSEASAAWTNTITNASGLDQTYTFNFQTGFRIKASPYSPLTEPHSFYSINMFLNNSVIWASSAEIYWYDPVGATGQWYLVKVGVDFGEDWNIYQDYYHSAPYAGSLNLGTYQNGQSFTLSYEINTAGWGFAFLGTADARPNCYATGSITSSTPVPEPTTLLLLGSGLIGLAGYGRKKFFKK